ncbi:MAG TPA: outer membrane beta-barrel protein [Pyrinomonadaceae bacterium]|jgi:hypothetical protein
MRKLFFLPVLLFALASVSFAQTGGEYNKVEFYGGYSHNRVDTGLSDDDPEFSDIVNEREGYHGFNASVTGNLTRYVGLKADYSFHRKTFDVTDGTMTVGVKSNLHNFLGGVQFKDNSTETKVKPFAHILAGVARSTFSLTNAPVGIDSSDFDDTGFAIAIGGGLDFRVSPRIDIRAIQFDYNPNRFDGDTSHNFRIGAGIVIH